MQIDFEVQTLFSTAQYKSPVLFCVREYVFIVSYNKDAFLRFEMACQEVASTNFVPNKFTTSLSRQNNCRLKFRVSPSIAFINQLKDFAVLV